MMSDKALSEVRGQFILENPLIEKGQALPCFHGYLVEDDLSKLLIIEGDYIFWLSATKLMISVRHARASHSLVIRTCDSMIIIDQQPSPFPTLDAALAQGKSAGFIINGAAAKLQRPVSSPQSWQLRQDRIESGQVLSAGGRSRVSSGKFLTSTGMRIAVAVKQAKKPTDAETLLNECRLLRKFQHPNIIYCHGVILKSVPPSTVLEMAVGGALTTYLQSQTPTDAVLARMCLDAAKGLEYLHSKQCVHRDVSAKNCLVAEQNLIKLSNFGMSFEGGFYRLNDPSDIPTQWSAPETLNDFVYTDRTDIWSFGVVMWEIWTLAQEPYRGMSKNEIKDKVPEGYRMTCPARMPFEVEVLTQKCWSLNPERRPPAIRLRLQLENIIGFLFQMQK